MGDYKEEIVFGVNFCEDYVRSVFRWGLFEGKLIEGEIVLGVAGGDYGIMWGLNVYKFM